MDVALLVIPECPHTQDAKAMLRTALNDVGLGDRGFEVVVIGTDDAVRAHGFAGSPTFVVDGSDLFPGGSAAGAAACRTYVTPSGLRGLPGLRDLRRALKRAADRTLTIVDD